MNIETFLYNAIRYIGILAPVPTAYIIAVSLHKHLDWHVIIAIVAAVIIEVVGFGVVYMYAIFREYNQSKRKSDPEAPLNTVKLLVALYLVSVLVLTVVLDIFPKLATYAPGLFPFLSIVGMALTALRFDHQKRLEAIALEKQERHEKREALVKAQPLAQDLAPALDTRAMIETYWHENPQGTHTAAGKFANVSRQRAQQVYKLLDNSNPAPNGSGKETTP